MEKVTQEQVKELNKIFDSEVPFDAIERLSEYQKIKILLCPTSFALVFPKEIWHKFDIEVNKWLHVPEGKSWLCDESFTMHKLNLDKSKIDSKNPDFGDFVADDLDVREKRVILYLRRTFLENPRAYPESPYFTLGAALNGTHRPLRLRLGGSFAPVFTKQ